MTSAKYGTSIDSVTVDTAVANSAAIRYSDFEKGMVSVPSGSSLTTLTWYASNSESGTYLPAYNASGAIAQTVAAGRVYPIPADLVGARFLKIAGDAAGVVGVTLKD
jgi:hypothetical protein